jgi:PEGA domain
MRLFYIALILLLFPLLVFAGKDPDNYPLKVHILQQSWGSHNLRYNEYRATGRGNILENNTIHAFDFTYDCSVGLRRTARNQPYQAKWKKPELRLAVLSPKIGKNDKYQECELKTSIHPGVYIWNDGGISELSQEEFKAWRAKLKDANASPGNPGAPALKVSVVSHPDSAEIEIDGEFMGNTPSVFELDPGEHSITVKKTGYKPWEKKLKLPAGEVKVDAELEAESPK